MKTTSYSVCNLCWRNLKHPNPHNVLTFKGIELKCLKQVFLFVYLLYIWKFRIYSRAYYLNNPSINIHLINSLLHVTDTGVRVLLRLECLAAFGGPSLSPGCNIISGLNLPLLQEGFFWFSGLHLWTELIWNSTHFCLSYYLLHSSCINLSPQCLL